MDTIVERSELPVLRVKADMQGAGPSAAFSTLEATLPSLRGRHFYGSFEELPEGERYYACVERVPSDPPPTAPVEEGRIAGGLYVRRKIEEWEGKLATLASHFRELHQTFDPDSSRPSLEFYRSDSELHLLLPVRSKGRSVA